MSKPNGISYGIVPEDEGSDMDVSSDDDGVSMYPTFTSTQNQVYQQQQQQQHQMPHENIVRDLQNHIHRKQSQVSPIIPRVESFASRTTTSASSSSYASRAAQQNVVVIDDDHDDSDTESSSSFHTAPSSPVDLTLNDQADVDMDQQPDLVDHLQQEYDSLTKELVFIDKEEERIIAKLEEKKAQLELIRVKQLELQVRKSIEKNRKAVMTPKPSLINGKGKEKVTNYKQISSSDEDDNTPMKKAKAVANPFTGRPQRQSVVNPSTTKPQKQAVANPFATKPLKQEVEEGEKESLEDDERRGRMIKGKRIVDSPIPLDNTPTFMPHFPQRHKKNNNYLQLVRKSQVSGNTTIGQMKMFLCDLYDKYLEDDDITEQQRAHYKDLTKKISKFDDNGDDYIPSKGCNSRTRTGKKPKRAFVPKTDLMLPPEYYGHPERLNFDDMSVDRNKLLDAINCVHVITPRRVRRINELLSHSPRQLNVTDFQGIIDVNGAVIDSDQVEEYTGPKKLNKLITLYMMVTDPKCVDNTKSSQKARAKVRAKAKAALTRKRLRPEAIESNQEAFSEPVAGFASSSRVTHQSTSHPTFISDIGSSSRASVVTPDVVSLSDHPSHFSPVEPFNQLFNPEPATTTSHSPGTQTRKPVSLLSPPAPAPASASAPAPALAPAPASIPSKQAPLQLYNGSPPPAQTRIPSPSPSSKSTTTTTNNQANTQNQYKPAFQPYRSVLNSLGVVSTPDVVEQKTGMLCRAESTGGICNDKRCPHMHFADFT